MCVILPLSELSAVCLGGAWRVAGAQSVNGG